MLVQTGDITGALRVLAIELRDIREALALCERVDAKDEAYLQLLEMLLHPPNGRPPLLSDACRLLATQGQIKHQYYTIFFTMKHRPQHISYSALKLFQQFVTEAVIAGAHLDPMRIVEVLSEDMPLAHAADVFARVMRDRVHRRRQNLICRNLHRSLNFHAAAERAEVSS